MTADQKRPVAPLANCDAKYGVLARFRAVVEAQPDATAVVDDVRAVTFAQLATEAATVRAAVVGAMPGLGPWVPPAGGGGSGPADVLQMLEPVGILAGHQAGTVAAVFGVIASGQPVVVLDARTPAARLSKLVERVSLRLLLCDGPNADVAAGLAEHVVRIDQLPVAAGVETLWLAPPDPAAAAMLSFTSGSTGRPKVVLIGQQQLTSDAWITSLANGCYGADDVMAHTLPMAFNAGLMVTVAGPLVGATMVMYDVRRDGIEGVPEWLDRYRVTLLQASPGIARSLLETVREPSLLGTLRSVTVSGEPVHGKDIERFRALLPATCTVYNRFGSSETGLIAEYAVRPGEATPEGPLPAGKPIGSTRVRIVDDQGDPVEPGRTGRLVVERNHLSHGYLGEPALNARFFGAEEGGLRSFRSNDVGYYDEAGDLRLMGRADYSVKIRGYLVEPGEVDAALFAMPEVREAVVIGAPRPGDGVLRLVAYVVRVQEQLSAAAVRARLRETLPAYMVPEAVVFLDSLPRTERGKLDRSALPEPPRIVPSSQGQFPIGWQLLVADMFKDALSLEDIGLDDDFFELGGDSLAAQSMIAKMHERGFSVDEVSTMLLVEAPTVRQFAAKLTRTPDSRSDVMIPLRREGSRPPLFVIVGAGGLGVAFVELARALGPEQPVWAVQAHAIERRGMPDWSVERTARRFVREIRSVQPRGPYNLSGHSFGGLVALEMAQQLQAAGDEVANLIMLDSFPPGEQTGVDAGRLPLPEKLRAVANMGRIVVQNGGAHRYQTMNRISKIMHGRYQARPYAGNTLVVVANSDYKDERGDWHGHLTGRWRSIDVSGDHISMMREPYVQETASAIFEALNGDAGVIDT